MQALNVPKGYSKFFKKGPDGLGTTGKIDELETKLANDGWKIAASKKELCKLTNKMVDSAEFERIWQKDGETVQIKVAHNPTFCKPYAALRALT